MTEAADRAEIIALPPVILAGHLAAGLAGWCLWPARWLGDWVTQPQRLWAGGLLVVLAVMISVAAIRAMARHQTSPHPHQPTSAIVAEGPFRYSRNPLYLSLMLIFSGVTVLTNAATLLLLAPVLLLTLNYGVIVPEERYLERKFGERYRQYRATVRRWL